MSQISIKILLSPMAVYKSINMLHTLGKAVILMNDSRAPIF
ncbi:protein of unknown function [Acidithiobacillus ferrivorans]|uniref:Uncharacterized protein n=1 Tax=Acidithiobacillus ferrivorans TaxID=160808 RepID=A0ABY1MRT2_9PROT|nr:protein of unknown function [Acidithiobacillus ferrivorans]